MSGGSRFYPLVVNLLAAERWHEGHCDSECSVSLYLLRKATHELQRLCTETESRQIDQGLDAWYQAGARR